MLLEVAVAAFTALHAHDTRDGHTRVAKGEREREKEALAGRSPEGMREEQEEEATWA